MARQVVTGVDHAWVNTRREPPEHVVMVPEGAEVPSDLAKGELDRLEAAGVFGEHPREAAKRELQSLIDQQLAWVGEPFASSETELNAARTDSDGFDGEPTPGSEAFAVLPLEALYAYADQQAIDLSGLAPDAPTSDVVEAINAAMEGQPPELNPS